MDEQARVAFIQSQTTCAMIEAMGMVAENQCRINQGLWHLVSRKEDFDKLIEKYGLGHNSVLMYLQGEMRP